MGEGIFLLFLTPAAPDYRILRGEPRKHHSAMLQLGRLPSPARGRTGGRQWGVGACTRGCERASVRVCVCVCAPTASRHGFCPASPAGPRQRGCPLPSNVFVFLLRLLIRLGLIAFGSVVGLFGGVFLACSLTSWDGNLHIITQHAFPAPSRAKTRNQGMGSKVHPPSFPSRKQTSAWQGGVQRACTTHEIKLNFN